jgi:hypothetical protein
MSTNLKPYALAFQKQVSCGRKIPDTFSNLRSYPTIIFSVVPFKDHTNSSLSSIPSFPDYNFRFSSEILVGSKFQNFHTTKNKERQKTEPLRAETVDITEKQIELGQFFLFEMRPKLHCTYKHPINHKLRCHVI